MTGTASRAAPAAHRAAAADALNRELAHLAFPDFWFSQITHRRHPHRWVAVCKNEATTGLYTVVTADLNMLTAVLTLDRAWRAGHGPQQSQA